MNNHGIKLPSFPWRNESLKFSLTPFHINAIFHQCFAAILTIEKNKILARGVDLIAELVKVLRGDYAIPMHGKTPLK